MRLIVRGSVLRVFELSAVASDASFERNREVKKVTHSLLAAVFAVVSIPIASDDAVASSQDCSAITHLLPRMTCFFEQHQYAEVIDAYQHTNHNDLNNEPTDDLKNAGQVKLFYNWPSPTTIYTTLVKRKRT